jgi:hypothetical protein
MYGLKKNIWVGRLILGIIWIAHVNSTIDRSMLCRTRAGLGYYKAGCQAAMACEIYRAGDHLSRCKISNIALRA